MAYCLPSLPSTRVASGGIFKFTSEVASHSDGLLAGTLADEKLGNYSCTVYRKMMPAEMPLSSFIPQIFELDG